MSNVAADSGLTLELTRHFDATPERVFDAWVTKDWCEWMGPAGSRCALVSMDLRTGGSFHLRMTLPDGRVQDVTGNYREMIRPERLVMTWTGDCTRFGTSLSLNFRRDGKGTLMTLRQEGLTDPTLHGNFKAGWSAPGNSFDRLAQHLAR